MYLSNHRRKTTISPLAGSIRLSGHERLLSVNRFPRPQFARRAAPRFNSRRQPTVALWRGKRKADDETEAQGQKWKGSVAARPLKARWQCWDKLMGRRRWAVSRPMEGKRHWVAFFRGEWGRLCRCFTCGSFDFFRNVATKRHVDSILICLLIQLFYLCIQHTAVIYSYVMMIIGKAIRSIYY